MHGVKKYNFLTIPAFEKLDGVRHAFTTRQNGMGARNSGSKHPDDWKLVAESLGIGKDRLVTVNQVHGEAIVMVDEDNFWEVNRAHADALITRSREIAIGIETADCVPILLYDPKKPAVAAVHAGWRSTVRKIVRKSVEKMREEFGSDPAEMIAAIGPAIGPECYEVDAPVLDPFREAFSFWEKVSSPRGNERRGLDLVKTNVLELMQSGLAEGNIHSIGICTSCRKDLFYSFRAEGRTGRMLSVIMIKP